VGEKEKRLKTLGGKRNEDRLESIPRQRTGYLAYGRFGKIVLVSLLGLQGGGKELGHFQLLGRVARGVDKVRKIVEPELEESKSG